MAYAGKLRAWIRRGLTSFAVFVALVAFAAFVPRLASAESANEPVAIVYDAPPSCPSREALVSAVEARRPVQPERSDRRTFRVRIRSSSKGGYDGRLDVLTDGESAHARDVHTSSCVEAMTSMAVFITLALASRDEPSVPVVPEPPPASVPSVTAPIETNESPSAPVPPPSAPPKSAPPRAAAPGKFAWTSGIAFVAAGLGKNALGARVSGELAYLPARARPGAALRLSWGWADFSTTPERAGEARFRLQTTRAEPCLELPWRTLSWSACGAVELGSLRATSADLPRTGRATMTWVAAGASTRLRWYILRGVSLEAGFAALAPFERRTFALAEPVRTIFRPAPVLFEGAFGLSVTATF